MATLSYEIDKLQYLNIGQQGESNANTIEIDMSSWVNELTDRGYENICCHLLFKPYNQNVPVEMGVWNRDTMILTWTITSAATAVAGLGYTEIRAFDHPDQGLLLKKSKVIPTTVNDSVSGVDGSTPPAPYDDWMNNILILIDQLNNALSGAAYWYAISTSATTRPDDSAFIATLPDLSQNKGKYLWTMTKITWSTGTTSNLYSVAYLAVDGSGAVRTVNGMAGEINLDGRNLYMDITESPQSRVALNEELAAIRLIAEAAVAMINNKTGSNITLYGTDINMSNTDTTTLKAAIDAKAASNNVVNSVNGKNGAVVLYSTEINLSSSDSTKVSAFLANHGTRLGTAETNITGLNNNKLDKSQIVYQENGTPAGVPGRIWLKPKT